MHTPDSFLILHYHLQLAQPMAGTWHREAMPAVSPKPDVGDRNAHFRMEMTNRSSQSGITKLIKIIQTKTLIIKNSNKKE